jgi:DNA primase
MSDVLSKLDNLVEREMYVKKFSDEYGISQESIYSEIIKRSKPKNNFKAASQNRISASINSKVSSDNKNITVGKCEKTILAILCLDNSAYKAVSGKISPDFFTVEANRAIAGIIIDKLKNKQDIAPAELLNLVDAEAADEFARIVQEECNYDDNIKAIYDLIKTIEGIRLDSRQNEILSLLSNKDKLSEGNVDQLKSELKILLQKKNIG